MRNQTVHIGGVDYHLNQDGFTHINIYSNGTTILGRKLSNFPKSEVVTNHGMFQSLEGYYHYLKLLFSLEESTVATIVRDRLLRKLEELRLLYGRTAQTTGRDLRKQFSDAGVWIVNAPDESFDEHFEIALYRKIHADPVLFDMVISNDLPYVHYYTIKGASHYKPHFSWLSDRVEKVAASIKEENYEQSRN